MTSTLLNVEAYDEPPLDTSLTLILYKIVGPALCIEKMRVVPRKIFKSLNLAIPP